MIFLMGMYWPGKCVLSFEPAFLFIFVMPRAITPGIKYTNMKSRITIEVDFDNENRAIIQIISTPSEDVRDSLIKAFLEKLAHTSSWLKIICIGGQCSQDPAISAISGVYHIWPIAPEELKKESDAMMIQYGPQREPLSTFPVA